MPSVRAYLELEDKWCPERREHAVSVYLTTRSNSNKDLDFNHQFSHSFVFRLRSTSSTTDGHSAQTIIGDDFSEHLHRAIFIPGTEFIPTEIANKSHETTKYLKKIGGSLFEALFQPDSITISLFDKVSNYEDLAFTLVTNSPLIDSIGWEYAYRRGNHQRKGYFLVQKHIFSRGLYPSDKPPFPGKGSLHINILAIPSKPITTKDDDGITVDAEWRTMSSMFKKYKCELTLQRVVPPKFASVTTWLGRSQYQIVLFSGHGIFADTRDIGQGFPYPSASNIVFEQANATEDLKPLDTFLKIFKNQNGCELVFLNCCQSTHTSDYPTIAHALKDVGVGHLIGMSRDTPDRFSRTFGDDFFRTIVEQGKTVEMSVLHARSVINDDRLDWIGIPVLYTSGTSIETTFNFPLGSPTIEDPSPVCRLEAINMDCKVIRGRSKEITTYTKAILDDDNTRVHTIIGAPGIGKTTIGFKVAEIVSRSIEGGVYGFSFESVLSETELLHQLCTILQLNTKELGNMVTMQECFLMIKPALQRHDRTVFLIDNFETLLTEEGHGAVVVLQRLIREIPFVNLSHHITQYT